MVIVIKIIIVIVITIIIRTIIVTVLNNNRYRTNNKYIFQDRQLDAQCSVSILKLIAYIAAPNTILGIQL